MDTEILANHTILFPSQVIELPIAGSASLLYPSGEVAATYPATVAASETNTTLQPSAPAASYGKTQAVDPVTSTKTNIQENDEAVAAPAGRQSSPLRGRHCRYVVTARFQQQFSRFWSLSLAVDIRPSRRHNRRWRSVHTSLI